MVLFLTRLRYLEVSGVFPGATHGIRSPNGSPAVLGSSLSEGRKECGMLRFHEFLII